MHPIFQDIFPCTAKQFFTLLLSDDSKFIEEFLAAKNDTNISVSVYIYVQSLPSVVW